MKAYFIITGAIFGLMTVIHIWKAIAEWPHSAPELQFVAAMGALILVPAALAAWAWHLLRKTTNG